MATGTERRRSKEERSQLEPVGDRKADWWRSTRGSFTSCEREKDRSLSNEKKKWRPEVSRPRREWENGLPFGFLLPRRHTSRVTHISLIQWLESNLLWVRNIQPVWANTNIHHSYPILSARPLAILFFSQVGEKGVAGICLTSE